MNITVSKQVKSGLKQQYWDFSQAIGWCGI